MNIGKSEPVADKVIAWDIVVVTFGFVLLSSVTLALIVSFGIGVLDSFAALPKFLI